MSISHDCASAVASFTSLVVSLNACSNNDIWRCSSAGKTASIAAISVAFWGIVNWVQVNVNFMRLGAAASALRHVLNLVSVFMPQFIYIALDYHPRCKTPKPQTTNYHTKYGMLFLSPGIVYTMGASEKIQKTMCSLLHTIAPSSKAGLKNDFSDLRKNVSSFRPSFGSSSVAGAPGINTKSQPYHSASPGFVKPMTNHKTTVLLGPNSKRASTVGRFGDMHTRRRI